MGDFILISLIIFKNIGGRNMGNSKNGLNKSYALGIAILAAFMIIPVNVGMLLLSNEQPVADAGEDIYVDIFEEVTFDGSGSYDPDGLIVKYEWSFGDGEQGLGKIASHTYMISGEYTVQLNVTDDYGDYTHDSITVYVNDLPVAIAGYMEDGGSVVSEETTVDIGEEIEFDASNSYDSDGDIVSYEWFFADGSFEEGMNPIHSYDVEGKRLVVLIVTDNNGSKSYDTIRVIVHNSLPIPETGGDIVTYEDYDLTFDGSGTWDTHPDVDSLTYSWDLGDGTTKPGIIVPNKYTESGTYNVILTATDNDGAIGRDIAEVTVRNVPPNADAGSDQTVYEDDIVFFNAGDSSDTLSDIDTLTYSWDFGDGSIGYGLTPDHVFTMAGTYPVTLSVTDDDGAVSTDVVMVTVNNVPPTADAGEDKTACEGNTLVFDGSESTDTPSDEASLDYSWSFGSNGMITSHNWYDDFDDDVYLTLTDDNGASDTDSAKVTILNVEPVAGINSYEVYRNVDFTLRITGEKYHDVEIELFEGDQEIWNEIIVRVPGNPDDQSVTLYDIPIDLTKTYSAKVYYTPENDPVNGQPNGASPCWIIMTYEDGSEDRAHHTFNNKHEDTWLWEPNLSEYLGVKVAFEGYAFDPGADDLTFEWDFGDGAISYNTYSNDGLTHPTKISERVVHKFRAVGNYLISLTVEDDDSGSGQDSINLILNALDEEFDNLSPTASADADKVVIEEEEEVSFTGDGTDFEGSPLTYFWYLGDGATSSDQNPSHSYPDAGTYIITLVVTDDEGKTGMDSVTVLVNNLAPIADAGDDVSKNEDQMITFDASDSSDSDSDMQYLRYQWNFGDGSVGYGIDTTHVYDNEGVYTVTLTVFDDNGATGTDTIIVTISNKEPTAEIAPMQDIANEDEMLIFRGSGSDSPSDEPTLTYHWDFGDGQTGEGRTATHTYTHSGFYSIILTVTDDNNAMAVKKSYIHVDNVPPNAIAGPKFMFSMGTGFLDFDGSQSWDTPSDLAGLSYSWDFNDLIDSNNDGDSTNDGDSYDKIVTHQYTLSGTYTVTLTVRDDDGSSSINEMIVKIILDSDEDGLMDEWEVMHDLDSVDGTEDNGPVGDPDEDMLINIMEFYFGTDPKDPDSDMDALKDYEELYIYGTNPRNPDTDEDLLLDGDEVLIYSTSPINPDSDEDDLNDGDEILVYSTEPLISDTDGDGLEDGPEVYIYYTIPTDLDSDNDGLSDGMEVLTTQTNATNPDTDGDGLWDGWHDANGNLTYDIGETAGESQFSTDPLDIDTDKDYLIDGEEVFIYSTIPTLPDSDDDYLLDGEELAYWETIDPDAWENDFDGASDFLNNLLDPDSDNDGLNDGEEVNIVKTLPYDEDTDRDSWGDGEEAYWWESSGLGWDSDIDGDGDANIVDRDSDNDLLKDGRDNYPHKYSEENRYIDADVIHQDSIGGYWINIGIDYHGSVHHTPTITTSSMTSTLNSTLGPQINIDVGNPGPFSAIVKMRCGNVPDKNYLRMYYHDGYEWTLFEHSEINEGSGMNSDKNYVWAYTQHFGDVAIADTTQNDVDGDGRTDGEEMNVANYDPTLYTLWDEDHQVEKEEWILEYGDGGGEFQLALKVPVDDGSWEEVTSATLEIGPVSPSQQLLIPDDLKEVKMYDNILVYVLDTGTSYDIFYYDMLTGVETRIDVPSGDDDGDGIQNQDERQNHPEIYGDRIVFTDIRSGEEEVFMYEISTKTLTPISRYIPGRGREQYHPDIYEDKIIWTDSNEGIWIYDIITGSSTHFDYDDDTWGYSRSNSIHGDYVAWWETPSKAKFYWELFSYHIPTGTIDQITSDTEKNIPGSNPVIYDDKIIFADSKGVSGLNNLYLYDISSGTETKLTNGIDIEPYVVDIYEQKIIYNEFDSDTQHAVAHIYSLDTLTDLLTFDDAYVGDIYEDTILYASIVDWGPPGDIDWYLYKESYPDNIKLDIRANGTYEFDSGIGQFNSAVVLEDAELKIPFNAELAGAQSQIIPGVGFTAITGYVFIPMNYSSTSEGKISVSNIEVVVEAIVTNAVNNDADGDGLSDAAENYFYFDSADFPHIYANMDGDNDGQGWNDWDSDGDGLSDGEEVFKYFSDWLNTDSDGDGTNDFLEARYYGTHPAVLDTDHDGMDDTSERLYWENRPDTTWNEDSDGDGIYNIIEWDSDDDGLYDFWQDKIGNGQWDDPEEEWGEVGDSGNGGYGTDPAFSDTDNDGLDDKAEIDYWDNIHKDLWSEMPGYVITTWDSDSGGEAGVINLLDDDSDGDGLLDGDEVNDYRSDPANADADDDKLNDNEEVIAGAYYFEAEDFVEIGYVYSIEYDAAARNDYAVRLGGRPYFNLQIKNEVVYDIYDVYVRMRNSVGSWDTSIEDFVLYKTYNGRVFIDYGGIKIRPYYEWYKIDSVPLGDDRSIQFVEIGDDTYLDRIYIVPAGQTAATGFVHSPYDRDSDGDWITDKGEAYGIPITPTGDVVTYNVKGNPLQIDSDHDFISDFTELFYISIDPDEELTTAVYVPPGEDGNYDLIFLPKRTQTKEVVEISYRVGYGRWIRGYQISMNGPTDYDNKYDYFSLGYLEEGRHIITINNSGAVRITFKSFVDKANQNYGIFSLRRVLVKTGEFVIEEEANLKDHKLSTEISYLFKEVPVNNIAPASDDNSFSIASGNRRFSLLINFKVRGNKDKWDWWEKYEASTRLDLFKIQLDDDADPSNDLTTLDDIGTNINMPDYGEWSQEPIEDPYNMNELSLMLGTASAALAFTPFVFVSGVLSIASVVTQIIGMVTSKEGTTDLGPEDNLVVGLDNLNVKKKTSGFLYFDIDYKNTDSATSGDLYVDAYFKTYVWEYYSAILVSAMTDTYDYDFNPYPIQISCSYNEVSDIAITELFL
jgi:beta propeller repeat protein